MIDHNTDCIAIPRHVRSAGCVLLYTDLTRLSRLFARALKSLAVTWGGWLGYGR
jgi:hypothetical protein